MILGSLLFGRPVHAEGTPEESGGGSTPAAAAAEKTSEDIRAGTFGLGLNYPGFGVRYFLTDHYAVEAKGQLEDSIELGGLRVYRYFRPVSRIFLFAGAEGDYVHFKGAVSRGSGAAGEIFGGFEYFILRRVSMQADFGPAYISLVNQDHSASVSGLEYVFNIGFNCYFGGRSAR
jgi:hypothetical protein